MFAIDTGDTGGSKGPWISWTSNGSAEKSFPPRSWVLRNEKDDNGVTQSEVIPAFVNGCVMDLDTLKLGWEKDGMKGMAPTRQWNPSIAQATPRPDESKKLSGSFTWSKALSVRCAIGGGKAATWEQGSYGAYDAFAKLAKQIEAQWAANSQNGALLPLVQQTGVDRQEMTSGATNKPILTIIKWVPRPDCLKANAPIIATAEPAPAAQVQPAQQTTSVIPADASF